MIIPVKVGCPVIGGNILSEYPAKLKLIDLM